jgi:prevent-host-death family protein
MYITLKGSFNVINHGEMSMHTVPQIIPVTEMRLRHKSVLELLTKGPVILAQHSKAAAVLISVEEWDRRARRLEELEWRERARQATKEARESNEPDLSFDEFIAELKAFHEQA